MKVCSFVPSATTMIYQMGLEDSLYGVTFECASDRPKIIRSYLEGNRYSSEEIDRIVSESKANGQSLYYVDEDLLAQIAPDVVFVQDVCDVCAISDSYIERAIFKLKKQPLVVPLIPRTLNDVFENAITIARTLQREEAADRLMAALTARMDTILGTLREHHAPLKRVMLMEWLNPIYNCGHWIPYQIAHAGGVDMLSNPSGYSVVTDWEKIRRYNPEVLVIAPCGFNVERAMQEIAALTERPGWNELDAVKNNAAYVADSDLFTQPSTMLVDGIELLASLFHPTLFPMTERFATKCENLEPIHAA